MADWSGDDETVVTDPWWEEQSGDPEPVPIGAQSHIRDVMRRPRGPVEEEPTTVMNANSQSELVQACQRTGQEWMVRNGSREVGPVSTTLLLEGILAQRVPSCCEVRRVGSSEWQPLRRTSVFAHAFAEVEDRS